MSAGSHQPTMSWRVTTHCQERQAGVLLRRDPGPAYGRSAAIPSPRSDGGYTSE
jgi:hypothetical protein